MMHAKLTFLPLVAAVLLSACATRPDDPLYGYNKTMFDANTVFDEAVMMPVAKGYTHVAPEPVRDGVHNALNNLNEVTNFGNNVLQGQPNRAGQNVARFLINSTIGLAGLFDAASDMGIEPAKEDFGLTLAKWGVGPGAYVVLPFFGPSNVRDSVGLTVDILTHPLTFMRYKDAEYYRLGRLGLTALDTRTQLLGKLEPLRKESVDPYASFRSLYEQTRQHAINDGKVKVDDLPSFDDE